MSPPFGLPKHFSPLQWPAALSTNVPDRLGQRVRLLSYSLRTEVA